MSSSGDITPEFANASETALATATGAATVGSSPIPLMPKGFVGEGVCWLSSDKEGSVSAIGMPYVIASSSMISRSLERARKWMIGYAATSLVLFCIHCWMSSRLHSRTGCIG